MPAAVPCLQWWQSAAIYVHSCSSTPLTHCCFATPLSLLPSQRLGAPVRNGLKLMCVGIGASFVGVAVTNTLIALRQALDPSFVPLNQAQNVLATSAAYGLYMATSSNIRYVWTAGFRVQG